MNSPVFRKKYYLRREKQKQKGKQRKAETQKKNNCNGKRKEAVGQTKLSPTKDQLIRKRTRQQFGQ